VYVGYDPIVLAHARALPTCSPEGETAYLDADIKDTGEILAGAVQVLNLSQSVGVMVAVLHMLRDSEDPHGVVDRLMAAVPAGSFLVISHLASDIQPEAMAETGRRLNQAMAQQFTMRSRGQVTAFFDGMTLLDPGVVLTHQWRPDSDAEAATRGVLWAGAARKDRAIPWTDPRPRRRHGLSAGFRRYDAVGFLANRCSLADGSAMTGWTW